MPKVVELGRENMDSDQAEHRITRRRMLKRIGAGAAVAWTAPILTSIRAPAFAASPICGAPCTTCFAVGSSAVCGSDGNGDCLCSQDVDGNCFCGSDIACAG